MSLKFAAVGSLMALSALESRAQTDDRSRIFGQAEPYDPLLAMIGRGHRAVEGELPETGQRMPDRPASS